MLLALAGAITSAAQPATATARRPVVAPEVPASATDSQGPVAANSPTLVADPTHPKFVVLANRVDAPGFGCSLQVSGDGGRGFVSAEPVPTLPEGAERCYGPEVAFDRDGALYFLFVGLAGNGNQPVGAFLTVSTDQARTFSPPRPVLGPHNFAVRMAIDTTAGGAGRLHLAWLAANTAPGLGSLPTPPNPIMAAYSDDGGASFSSPVQVSDPRRDHVVAPALALGPDDAVHVAYYDLGDDRRDYHGLAGPTWEGEWSLVVASSRDGGRSFGPGSVVDDVIVPTGRVMLIFTMPPPALAAGRGRDVFVAWPDARHGDADVLMRRSGDAGRSWAEPVRLNDDPIGNGRAQDLPRISVAPGGRVDAIFYDRRDDPANRDTDVRYTWSDDGGRRFAPNFRVTSTSFNSQVGQRYLGPAAQDLVDFGARIGLLSTKSGAVAAWTDTRNSLHPVQQDIFATTIDLPKGAPGRAWSAALLGGAAVAAAVVVLLRRRRAPPLATVLLGVVAASALHGCGGADSAVLPPPPAVIDVGMEDHRFDYRPFIPAGRVVFRVLNRGAADHQLLLARLPDDLLPLDEQLHSDVRRPLETLRTLPAYSQGEAGSFAVDLAPGRYGFLCFLQEPGDTVSHALKGMNSEFRVL